MGANHDVCPNIHKELRKEYRCPIPKRFGKCFTYCDLTSDRTCGQCVHWYGHVTHPGERHEYAGHCPHYIGGVSSVYRTNCPHFRERPEGFPIYPDCVEARTAEIFGEGYDPHDPAVRPARAQARKEWLEMWK